MIITIYLGLLAFMIVIGHQAACKKSFSSIQDRAIDKYSRAISQEDKDEIKAAWKMFVTTRAVYY